MWPALGKHDGWAASAPVLSFERAFPRLEPQPKLLGFFESLNLFAAARIRGNGDVFGGAVVVPRFEADRVPCSFEEPKHELRRVEESVEELPLQEFTPVMSQRAVQ
jgi:hypothetical protein